jgi:hypothetical protein
MVFDRFQLFLSVVLVVLNGPTGDLPQILPRGFLGSTLGSESTLALHQYYTTTTQVPVLGKS